MKTPKVSIYAFAEALGWELGHKFLEAVQPSAEELFLMAKTELDNYFRVREVFLLYWTKCCRCGHPAKEIDHRKGRRKYTKELPNLVAPMNMQPMCGHLDFKAKHCHELKTATGNRQDWRSPQMKTWAEKFQLEIEAELPKEGRVTPWRPYDPEVTQAIKTVCDRYLTKLRNRNTAAHIEALDEQ